MELVSIRWNRTGMAIMELGQGEILTPISPFN